VRTLAMTSRVVERALDDMTLAQFRVLTLIASSPERASRIAERAAVTKPSLTGLLDGLEAKGWVRRVDVKGDKRGVRLEVTARGRAAQHAAERAMSERLGEVLAVLPADERARVVDGLGCLTKALSERFAVRR